MKKTIILITILLIGIVIAITLSRPQTTNLNIERSTEYLGPNVDSPSLSNQEINFNQDE